MPSTRSCRQFHGLSPIIKSLRVTFVSTLSLQILDLDLDLEPLFPILEDLAVSTKFWGLTDKWNSSDGLLTIVDPPSPLIFTGSLETLLKGGARPVLDQLFSLLGGIHFRKLTLRWFQWGDPLLTTGLLERCSRTIESLDIAYYFGTPVQHSVSNGSFCF